MISVVKLYRKVRPADIAQYFDWNFTVGVLKKEVTFDINIMICLIRTP